MFEGLLKKKKVEEEVEIVNHATEARNFTPGVPFVNVLPERVTVYYKVKQIAQRFVIGGVLLGICFGGYYAYSTMNMSNYDEEISRVEDRSRTLQQQTTELTPFKVYHDEVSKMRSDISELVTVDPDTAPVIEAVSKAAASAGISLSSVKISVTASSEPGPEGAATVGCQTPDPFGQATGAGCVDFTGQAPNRASVARFTEALNNTPGLSGTYIPTSSVGEGGASVSGSVIYAPSFFLKRFEIFSLSFESVLESIKENGSVQLPEGNEEGTPEQDSTDNDTETETTDKEPTQ